MMANEGGFGVSVGWTSAFFLDFERIPYSYWRKRPAVDFGYNIHVPFYLFPIPASRVISSIALRALCQDA